MHRPEAIAAISDLFGKRFFNSEAMREQHARNESYYPLAMPEAVAFPQNTAEVSEALKVCNKLGIPVVPWGAGTSLEGNALAIQGGLCLDLSQMNRVLRLNPEDMDVVIQPGVTREALNEDLRASGLFFPVDPGANATIGGMAATRASGTTAVRYGTMRDNVMALEVVLADGQIIRTGTRARKSAAGYDLTRLIVGSEGTLGVITELTLKLHGQPEATAAATCAFPNIDSAVQMVTETIQMGVPMARIEFLDAPSVRACNQYSHANYPEQPHLFLEFHGSEQAVAEQAANVGQLATEHGGEDFTWATKPEERNLLWSTRHSAYLAIKALRPGCLAVVTDVCVPISRLADAVNETAADIAASGLLGPILGHVGDGNFHAALLVDPAKPEELETARALSARISERALAMGGTVTGEHGVGIGKKRFMEAEHGAAWAVMAQIKRSLDPNNILNPGKVVRIT